MPRFYSLQLAQARAEAESILQQAQQEARRCAADLTKQRKELYAAEDDLRRRELAVERATAAATASADASRTEARRLQEAKGILAERERLAATREEINASREAELQRREADLAAAEVKFAHLARRLQATRQVPVSPDAVAPLSLIVHSPEQEEWPPASELANPAPLSQPATFVGEAQVNGTASPVAIAETSASSSNPLATTVSKGASRLRRLEGIVRSIAQAGTADRGALNTTQANVRSLEAELEQIQDILRNLELGSGSGGVSECEGELKSKVSAWEAALGRALEEVVAMQRKALAARSPLSPSSFPINYSE